VASERDMGRALRQLVLCVLFALPAMGGVATAQDAGANAVVVAIDSPAPGAPVKGFVHQAEISGLAAANSAGPQQFDVMLVIDVSGSTNAASGSDVDGDGEVGVNPRNELLPPGAYSNVLSTDLQDTVLHAQISAAHALLDGLDPRRVRVGVLSFSGEVDPLTGMRKRIDQEDAHLEIALTDDYDAVRRTLSAILARGARGATNFAAGIRLGISELSGLPGARSTARPGSRKVILFLTDGLPTLPVGRGNEVDAGDNEAALRTAALARTAGISINTYALGPQALTYPKTVTEIARVTGGTYTPVQSPGDIIALLGGITFADVEDVVFTNLSTGELSTDVRLNPDGSFNGFLPVREGRNRVRVIALASDGTRGTVEFEFDFQHTKAGSRDRLAELERIRQQNKQLEIQRQDLEIDAFRAEQQKQLELEVERGAR